MKFLLIFIGSCFLSVRQDEFLEKYSGSYNIMVGSDGSEAYALKADGSAVWVYGWKNSSGKIQAQKKYGTWTAREGFISVSIKGNRGTITEEYRMKGGRFVSSSNPQAYLKRN